MDPGAILVATCLASAFATLLMGLWARYPIAVARLARRAPGAIVIGTLATGLAAGLAGFVRFHGILAPPPSLAPTFGRLDLGAALRPELVHVVFVLFFLGLFDTVGTLVGVA